MRQKANRLIVYVFIILLLFVVQSFAQQNLPFIRVSPQAKVVQNVGFAKIEIDYSRPGVKERKIYGEVVPYGLAPNDFGNGKPMPWRAGANENTTISFSHDAKINGNPLPAGTYSLHMLVTESDWTIIFNKDFTAWGSFFYEEANDALRFTVQTLDVDHQEWLMYGFENVETGSCDVFLHWEMKKVVFNVEFDLHQVVLDTYRQQLTMLPGFNPAAWGVAARYCLQNELNLDEAKTWIDKALSMNGGNTFGNNSVKAGLLSATGKQAEGTKLMDASIDLASEAELNNYGYQLLGQNRIDEAIKFFKLNIKRFPDSWNTYDSLAEALATKDDKARAIKNYKKALNMAPANQKERIEGILETLD
jgi:tetratricopeptide (TPR) repeat protein